MTDRLIFVVGLFSTGNEYNIFWYGVSKAVK
jgi:hypothetical protein